MRAKNYNDWKTFSEKTLVSMPTSVEITALIRAWGGGDQTALDRLTPLVYDELRRIARLVRVSRRTKVIAASLPITRV